MADGRTTVVKDITEEDRTKDTILNMVAGGEPYVFLTASIEEVDGQEMLITKVMAALPAELVKEVLTNALESVDQPPNQ